MSRFLITSPIVVNHGKRQSANQNKSTDQPKQQENGYGQLTCLFSVDQANLVSRLDNIAEPNGGERHDRIPESCVVFKSLHLSDDFRCQQDVDKQNETNQRLVKGINAIFATTLAQDIFGQSDDDLRSRYDHHVEERDSEDGDESCEDFGTDSHWCNMTPP